ncbi:MAG: M48 family metalloprotease [Pseudomonadota bacterium]
MIELVEFNCGSCEAPNRLQTAKLLRLSRSPRCGKCGEPLFRSLDSSLGDIAPSAYQHPLDKDALEALQKIPGIRTLLRRVIRWTLELNLRLSQAANTVQVSAQQMPEIYARFEDAAARLGITPLPELYVVQNPFPNASTYGVEQYFVTVTTGALELLDAEEQIALFAHELGHIHSDHMLYKTAARFISALASRLAAVSFGLGGLIALPLQLGLMWWDRCAELTADRAALLAVRRPEVVLHLLMKIAGGAPSLLEQLNFEAFLQQADRLDKMSADSGWARALMLVQEMFRSHPFPVYRAKEIVDWVSSGNYLEILDGEYRRRSDEDSAPCASCHKPVLKTAMVCPHCGVDPRGGTSTDDEEASSDGPASVDDFFAEASQAASGAVKNAGDVLKNAAGEAASWWKKTFEAKPGATPTTEDGDEDGADDEK